jgi:ADP-ribose pyrophosphatase
MPAFPEIKRELLYKGERVQLFHIHIRGRNGEIVKKEFVAHPGAVVILPLLGEDKVCLIKNYRYSAQRELLELPAGTLEPGEERLLAAQRELAEETGYSAKTWKFLTEFWVSPGVYGEKMWLYLARDLISGRQQLDETEQIETFPVSWAEAQRLALQGQIQDAKTLIGLFLWERLRNGSTP